jgi:hypothetical protein
MKRKPHFLGFAAEINGKVHPAALFKIADGRIHLWDCHHPSTGHTIIFDIQQFRINRSVPLSQGQVFQSVEDQHRAFYTSGDCHLAVTASGREKEYPTAYRSVPFSTLSAWDNLSTIDIPLAGHFFFEMDAPPWVAVKQPEILRAEDFNGAAGICLHAYICKSERGNDLIETWGKKCGRRWIVGDGPFRLVVLGEG